MGELNQQLSINKLFLLSDSIWIKFIEMFESNFKDDKSLLKLLKSEIIYKSFLTASLTANALICFFIINSNSL